MATIFMMNEEIARGMVCFFHQKKHSYLILLFFFVAKTFQIQPSHKGLAMQADVAYDPAFYGL
jgi:hypothetical protein